MTRENYIGIRKTLAETIKGTMWENHVFLVGGCVRDELMHMEIHDIDIAIDLPNGGIRFARWLEKKHMAARGRSIQVFVHFGTAKIQLRMFPTEVIDCVQTRKDKYIYEKNPKPQENFGTVLEDAIRRDLTINSLFVNISTGELLDPTGMGLQDIENHIIRTPNDPDITLTDNPMHLLRCIRFAVKYGWEISPALIEDLKRNVGILEEATSRRMLKEVISIVSLKNKEQALQMITDIGAMPYVEPTLKMIQAVIEAGQQPEQLLNPPQPSRRKRSNHRYWHKKKDKGKDKEEGKKKGKGRDKDRGNEKGKERGKEKGKDRGKEKGKDRGKNNTK